MKIHVLLISLLFSIFLPAQITESGMNGLKISQTLQETEKMTGQKLKLKLSEEDWGHIATVRVQDAELKLVFIDINYDEGKPNYILFRISTQSTKIKTVKGMGVGNTLDELWNTYKNHSISIWKDWAKEELKTKDNFRIFTVQASLDDDLAPSEISFYLKNNKVYKVEVYLYEGC